MWILGGVLAGLVAGSFVATLVVRWPEGRPATGRSACDSCGVPLRAADLVPLLSFAVLRGRCRLCRRPIDRRHPAIELAAAVIGGLALWADSSWHGFAGALLGWFLLGAFVLDAEHLWLPDRLTLPLLGLGLWLGHGSFADRCIGAAAGGGLLLLLALAYRRFRGRDGLGLGDVKLVAALGAWLGWQALPGLLLGASACGLLLALWLVLSGRTPDSATRLPFGACLCVVGFPLWLLG